MPSKTQPTTKKNPAAQALGRLGGSAGTAAQHAARARNAKKGGRPGRVCTTCGSSVKGGHDDRRLDVSCGAHGWRWSNGTTPEADLLRELLDVLAASRDPACHAFAPRVRRALRGR